MANLQQIKTAVQCFLKLAYPSGMPEKTKVRLKELKEFKDDESFFNWDFLEIEGDRTSMRWGNAWYPHMKLIFRGNNKSDLLFYVDAHDKHFSLPPQFEDRLTLIRDKNQETKQKIESLLQENNLSIMSSSKGMEAHYDPLPRAVNVMAIDDERHILNLIKIFATRIGASAVPCIHVDEAIEKIEKGPLPDLILCDIMMPEKSGYYFYDWLTARDLHIPFYFVTGLDKESVRMPDVPIIQKPFKISDIYAAIQEGLHFKQMPDKTEK